jgi:hypothetical protein
MRSARLDSDRVPSHIASLRDAKTREEMIALVQKFLEKGISSGPSINGEKVLRELIAELNTKCPAKDQSFK